MIYTLIIAIGLLRVSGVNPRYVVDATDTNKALFLTGNHFWPNMQDQSGSDPPSAWPFSRDLDTMSYNKNNFVRLWNWSQYRGLVEGTANWYFAPDIWYHTGVDYDLDSINQEYVDRVQTRLDSLAGRGMYGSVMLFEGWSIPRTDFTFDTWQYHPMNGANNVNSISPASADVIHYAPSNGGSADVWAKWYIYLKRMIDSLQAYDNFVWEVANEIADITGNNRHYAFNRLVIDTVKAYEGRKAKQHAIIYSGDWTTYNDSLFASPAHIVIPAAGAINGTVWGNDTEGNVNPPDSSGRKVVMQDTDHTWGMLNAAAVWYVWECFTRGGGGVLLQDNRAGTYPHWDTDNVNWPPFKRACGIASILAQEADLLYMAPSAISSTSTYEIAGNTVGRSGQVIVWQTSGTVTVDLSAYDSVNVKWIDPDDLVSGTYVSAAGTKTAGGASRDFTAPDARYDILYLYEDEPVVETTMYIPWRF